MGREEHGEKDLKYITLTVKHGRGGVMAWARMAATKARLLIEAVAVLSAQIQPNASKLVGQNFTF